MRITETCGCGASITVEDDWPSPVHRSVNAWRRDHRHDSRPTVAPGSDERGGATGHRNAQNGSQGDGDHAACTADHDNVASETERAEPSFGFGGEGTVIA